MNADRTLLAILIGLIAATGGLLVLLARRLSRERIEFSPEAAMSRYSRGRQILLIAAWFGLTTGVVHVALGLIDRYLLDRFLMVGPQMFWMTPLADMAIFAGLAVPLALVAAIRPGAAIQVTTVSVFSGLGVLSLLLPFPQVHFLAALFLALGVGAQAGRMMAPRMASWLVVMKQTAVRALCVIGGVAVVTWGVGISSEAYALASVPSASSGAPNVLFIVMDTVRAESLSLYGYGRSTTPNLQRWANESVVFDMALSTSPWTLKSHGTMFSGLYPTQIQGNFEHPANFQTPVLPAVFRDRGYVTAGFVANLLYTSWESGLTGGFVHYDDYRLSLRQLLLHSWIPHSATIVSLAKSHSLPEMWNAISRTSPGIEMLDVNRRTYGPRQAEQITDAFLEWQSAQGGRPFFAFLNYFDAHYPYRSTREFERRFALSGDARRGLYDGAIAYLDSEIDRLFRELRTRGVLDDTIVVLTSDHGEQFDEHGLQQHANSLYLDVLHVPLMIRYPSHVPSGLRVSQPVTLRDLAATVTDLAGLSDGIFPGSSLASLWSVQGAHPTSSPLIAYLGLGIRRRAEATRPPGPMYSAFDERYHYIRVGNGREMLFAYRKDPGELTDLSRTDTARIKVQELRGRSGAMSPIAR